MSTQPTLLIEMEVQRREIEHLLHFTKIVNLPSILQHGLYPRANLEALSIPYSYNDEIRLDCCEDASCLSISFPNYKMFFKKRIEDLTQEWVVISLSPKLLWEKNCAFCNSNAASSEVSKIQLNDRKKPEAFLQMFNDINGYQKRNELGINDNLPTNPQAEVLVFDIIETDYFQGFFFQNYNSMLSCQCNIERLKKVHCKCEDKVFKQRSDSRHWKN